MKLPNSHVSEAQLLYNFQVCNLEMVDAFHLSARNHSAPAHTYKMFLQHPLTESLPRPLALLQQAK